MIYLIINNIDWLIDWLIDWFTNLIFFHLLNDIDWLIYRHSVELDHPAFIYIFYRDYNSASYYSSIKPALHLNGRQSNITTCQTLIMINEKFSKTDVDLLNMTHSRIT